MYRAGNSVEQVFGGTVIKQGDRTPLGFNFRTENGELVYLTDSTVQVKVASDKGVVLEKQATISDEYTVQFAIGSQDITGAGDMRIEFIVTYPGGTIEKFPSDDWQRIRITPTLEDVEKYGVGYITFEQMKTDIDKKYAGFQSQLDSIVEDAGNSNPEIVQARVDNQGTIFNTLKNRIDFESSKIDILASSIVYVENFKIISPEVDDRGRLQRALDTGKNVLLQSNKTYNISSGLTLKADYQTLYGGGKIVCSATSGNVLTATNLKSVKIIGIRIEAGNAKTVTGVFFNGCSDSSVELCEISKYGDSGIKVTNSTSCSFYRNKFLLAAGNDSFGGLPTAADINIYGTNSSHNVTKNYHRSSGGYGIHIRTFNNGENNDYHTLDGNDIDGYNSYGIMLYRNTQVLADVPYQSVKGCKLINNTIKNITGERPSDMADPATKIFGMGIYLQGAEYPLVHNNHLDKTCRDNNSELLAPGAIGMANVGSAIISKNIITNSYRFGLYVNDVLSYGYSNGFVILDGNEIDTATRAAIKIIGKDNMKIINHTINAAEYGIFTTKGTRTANNKRFEIDNNTIINSTVTGMSLADLTQVILSENIIDTAGTHGVSLNNSTDFTLSANRIKSATSRGLEIGSGCSGVNKALGNTVLSCGVGMMLNAPIAIDNNNVESNSANYSGTYAPFTNLGDNATPDVKYRKNVQVAPTSALTYTNFLNGVVDQEILIQATNANATIAHNANILLAGGTNFVMNNNSMIRLLKTAGVWIEMYRKT
ncbi:right-handed parallel beta-helix repeat-containing protein [Priestia megaterium]|uniref:right-handed parallel beta-helix repeat-containing protein n=1 Tax=Priestia megaterium TaxID=1404 RepID=UPI001E3C3A01|nr:right-handed parallel beta-helix repeat-containing protein [Priestia megaterium]MCE4092867.1 right-handed parallel beta-helix repeat-containing protein [Priestia megaterium]